ncbi:MAG: hypothetical protein KU37_10855 [Sulfuricurvum sp. PC08-66]|nr:MAG: hypothetical protein KU37_10855 [Sulfuricurvum sp. PC08-66]
MIPNVYSAKPKSFRYAHIYLPIGVLIFLVLFIDSASLAAQWAHTQWLSNVLAFFAYVWLYVSVPRYLRRLMLYGLAVAVFGESLFSLVLEMYTYRLHNIPLYVILGHSLLYVGVYYLAKEPWVKAHRETIVRVLLVAAVGYSTLWLVWGHDLLGFILMVALVGVLRRYVASRLFFLIMFFAVVYLELWGTYFGCWVWPAVWFDTISVVPSANPPSGIGAAYFLYDVGCLWLYKQFHPRQWRILRRIHRHIKISYR